MWDREAADQLRAKRGGRTNTVPAAQRSAAARTFSSATLLAKNSSSFSLFWHRMVVRCCVSASACGVGVEADDGETGARVATDAVGPQA